MIGKYDSLAKMAPVFGVLHSPDTHQDRKKGLSIEWVISSDTDKDEDEGRPRK